MSGIEGDLYDVFTTNNLTRTDCELVAHQFGLTTISLFADFFENDDAKVPFKPQMFDKVQNWHGQEVKVPRLRQALRAARVINETRLGMTPGHDDKDLDAPIGTQQHKTLVDNFRQKHAFDVPTAWYGCEQVLGRAFRALNMRRVTADPLKIYASADAVSVMIRTPAATRLPGSTLAIQDVSRKPPPPKPIMQVHDPWQYLLALQFWLWTQVIAGCFQIDVTMTANGASTTTREWMIEMKDLMNHCACATAFVMKWSHGKGALDKVQLLKELKRHDESIRAAWNETFRRKTMITYSMAINEVENIGMASRHWDTDYAIWQQCQSLTLATTPKSGATNRPSHLTNGDTPTKRGDRGKGAKGDKGRRDRSRTPRKDRKRSRSRSRRGGGSGDKGGRIQVVERKGKIGDKTVKVLSARPMGGGKFVEYCTHHHGKGGCKTKDCPRRHKCDVIISQDNGRSKACDENHKRSEHTGATIDA